MSTAKVTFAEPRRRFSLEYVRVDELKVDESYQRVLAATKVAALRRSFDEELAEVLRVSRRADGSLYIIDGQHRWTAAKELGLTYIDAHVYDGLTPQDEARLFRGFNTQSSTPKAHELFKARLREGDPKAHRIKAIVESYGFEIRLYAKTAADVKPSEISCTRLLEQMYDDYQPFALREAEAKKWIASGARPSGRGEDRLNATLNIIAHTWPSQEKRTSAVIVQALDYLWTRYGDHIKWQEFYDKVGVFTPQRFLLKAAEDAGSYHESQMKRAAKEMLKVYNRGRRRRISLQEV